MKKLMIFFLGTLVIELQSMHRFRLKSKMPITFIASWRTLKYPQLKPFHNKFMRTVRTPIVIVKKNEIRNAFLCPFGFTAPCNPLCSLCDVDGIPPVND